MNILLFGDVIGRPGRKALQTRLPSLRKQYSADLVVANVENLAHGFGITPDTVQEVLTAGVDVCTSGNHVWKNVKGVDWLRTNPESVVVPANIAENRPGRGFVVRLISGIPLLIINVLGEVFMKDAVQSPFETFDRLYEEHGASAITIVDLHAEATGEKRAFSWYVDGRASVVVGTHTHVPTADAHILPKKTAYVTDLGMCGAVESSLGMDIERVLEKVARKKEIHLEPPQQPHNAVLNGVCVQIDEKNRRATSIERIDQIVRLAYTQPI